jgi:hypothetical protein
MRSAVGRVTIKIVPARAAKNSNPAARIRNGELSLRRRRGVLAFKPSNVDMVPPSYE